MYMILAVLAVFVRLYDPEFFVMKETSRRYNTYRA